MIRTDNACQPDRLDPASLSTLSGLEIVNRLADGRLPRPPMAETLPFTVLPPSAGRVELRAVPETHFLNPMGIVHGGWAMTNARLGNGVVGANDARSRRNLPVP
jgi:hypothetical protein